MDNITIKEVINYKKLFAKVLERKYPGKYYIKDIRGWDDSSADQFYYIIYDNSKVFFRRTELATLHYYDEYIFNTSSKEFANFLKEFMKDLVFNNKTVIIRLNNQEGL